jgi:multisite-specific tRNA:(cytosine-C5)-methyltransferase
MRKNPAIWSKWSTDSSVTLHPLQLSIAARGFQLLKPGGLMVYSTCSMSPYEDEAVVAELLRRFKGSIELVDGRDFIPGFKARPGLSKWAVINDFGVKLKQKRERREKKREARGALLQPDSEQIDDGSAVKVDDAGAGKEGPDGGDDDDEEEEEEEEGDEHNIINSSDPEVVACIKLGMSFFPTYADVPAFVQRKFRSTLFEPSAEEAAWMHLERCLRCLPHDEDTGGFFVATLRKIPTLETSVEEPLESAIEVNSVETLAVDGEVKEEKAGKDKVQQGGQGSRGLVDFVRWGSEQFAVVSLF